MLPAYYGMAAKERVGNKKNVFTRARIIAAYGQQNFLTSRSGSQVLNREKKARASDILPWAR